MDNIYYHQESKVIFTKKKKKLIENVLVVNSSYVISKSVCWQLLLIKQLGAVTPTSNTIMRFRCFMQLFVVKENISHTYIYFGGRSNRRTIYKRFCYSIVQLLVITIQIKYILSEFVKCSRFLLLRYPCQRIR